MSINNFANQRKYLVAWLKSQGVHDPGVLRAMTSVPREQFVNDSLLPMAYADRALPTSQGQTISQPLMVGIMTQALQLTGHERILEIGTGSGYQTAVLACLAAEVISIERYQQLALLATMRLHKLAIQNISIFCADGSLGWSVAAPYDRIIVTAAAPIVPLPLLNQLKIGGLLVIPVGKQEQQELQLIQRTLEGKRIQSLGNCVFVPLIGQDGWPE